MSPLYSGLKACLAGILLFGNCIYAQENVNIYNERTSFGYIVYVDNAEYCPMSIELNLKLTNLRPADENQSIVVIPARSERVQIAELIVIKPGKETGIGVEVRGNYGDHFLRKPEGEFVYNLPFRNGESFLIGQGYNGSFSHMGENALDFNMPLNTHVYAARSGIVSKVVQKHNRHCAERECGQYNNFIRIYHEDGTFAEYQHLKKDGAVVREGDLVETGQHIGYSGNTGWASGPHLHFCVFLQRIDRRETLKTLFKINKDRDPEYLVEKRSYRREYE